MGLGKGEGTCPSVVPWQSALGRREVTRQGRAPVPGFLDSTRSGSGRVDS